MRIAFDTSVMVAALVESHPHHLRAQPWIEAVNDQRSAAGVRGSCSWHAMAETWSVLTSLPLDPPIEPAMAELSIARLCAVIVPTSLDEAIYSQAIRRCASRGLRSGALFDALHLVGAERDRAEIFATFNARDFERLLIESSPRIVIPPDPPGFRV